MKGLNVVLQLHNSIGIQEHVRGSIVEAVPFQHGGQIVVRDVGANRVHPLSPGTAPGPATTFFYRPDAAHPAAPWQTGDGSRWILVVHPVSTGSYRLSRFVDFSNITYHRAAERFDFTVRIDGRRAGLASLHFGKELAGTGGTGRWIDEDGPDGIITETVGRLADHVLTTYPLAVEVDWADESDPDGSRYAKAHGLERRVLQSSGPGGGWPGWPVIEFTGPRPAIEALATEHDCLDDVTEV